MDGQASQASGHTPRHGHNTHAMPPQDICDLNKKYQKMPRPQLESDADIIDFSKPLSERVSAKLRKVGLINGAQRQEICQAFNIEQRESGLFDVPETEAVLQDCQIYEHVDFEGLQIYPGILPPSTQIALLSRLLHVELSNPIHITNIHDEYNVEYSAQHSNHTTDPVQSSKTAGYASFFSLPQSPTKSYLTPKDPDKNKPLNIAQFMRALRYLTIGSQYNWATRQYPPCDEASKFPFSIEKLVSGFFPTVKSESGVILLYSPRDFMPVHRDVSEESPHGIVSISLGCDGIFVIARKRDDTSDPSSDEQENDFAVIRVRSGDIVHMAGETRFAWHAMSRVLSGTCPSHLNDWPVNLGNSDKRYAPWKGWMSSKRLNISCRQVYQP